MITGLSFASVSRALKRDARARESRILAAALAIAVAAVSAVGFFTDRVDRGLAQRASTLLAADLVIESSREIDEAWVREARQRGLETAKTVAFPTVLVADERTELVSVKAVSPNYPLRGEAEIADTKGGAGGPARSPPQAGTVWLDPRLFERLAVEVGDRLAVGEREFEVGAALVVEPDRSGALFQLAPRVMMARQDLAATGLLGGESRVTHSLLVAGSAQQVAGFRDWVSARAESGVEIEGVADARPEIRAALDRAQAFLGLAAMMTLILAGGAVAISVHAFAGREADVCALMRCFGARQRRVVMGLVGRLLVIGVIASSIGVGLGWLAQLGLVALVGGWFDQSLPAPGYYPVASGLVVGLVTLIGFGLVPALRIRRIPVIRVLRRDQAPPEPSATAAIALALAAVTGLVLYQAGDWKLGFAVLAGTVGLLLALGGAAWLFVRLIERWRSTGLGPWRFGLAGLARRPRTTIVQAVGFGLGLLALLLLGVVRVDLLDAWEQEIPADAPNQFMINVQPNDVDPVRQRLATAGVEVGRFYPLIRGRLIRINEQPVQPENYEDERSRRLVEREFNLSWGAQPPHSNEIVAGRWWSQSAADEWSVEEGIAERLGIERGDELHFRIRGETVSGTVTSLRRVDWASFRPNFFVFAHPSLLSGFGGERMTAYRLPAGAQSAVTQIARDFPAVTVLDVAALIERVRSVIAEGTRAVEYVFGFTLLAGLTVLVAAVNASREERRVEIALLRTLGASRARIRRQLLAEFGCLGALAGALAAFGAGITGWVVSAWVLELPYSLNPWLPVLGIGGGALLIIAAGLASTWRWIDERPSRILAGA